LNQLEIKALNESLGIDIMKLRNAEALAAKKEEEGISEANILAVKQEIDNGQLASFERELVRDEAAKTAEERKAAFEDNLTANLAAQTNSMDEHNNLALILQGIQVAIQIAMGAQAVASSLKAATEKETLRAAVMSLPKMAMQAISSGITATAKFLGMSASTLGIGAIATLAAAAIGVGFYNSSVDKVKSKAKATGDLSIDPNGGPVVMSPQEGGIFQGTKNDGVSMSPSHGSGGGKGGGGVNIQPLLRKMDQLIAAVTTQRVLSVDGYQLNEALHLEKTPAGL